MSLSPVNLEKFLALHQALDGVKYGLGAKAEGGRHPNTGQRFNTNSTGKLSTPVSTIQHIDCSGYVRYMLYHCAGGLMIPDGSWNQRAYCERNGLEEVPYKTDAMIGAGTLYIAFATAGVNGTGTVGHVWFVYNGKTYESYSSKGVGSLAATQSWRASHVHKTFVYPTIAKAGVTPTYTLRQSNGAEMAQLPVFDGRSYVPARTWAAWFGQQVFWDGATGEIELYNAERAYKVFDDVKLIKGVGHIRFSEAAAFTGVNYVTDNAKRDIRLQPRG